MARHSRIKPWLEPIWNYVAILSDYFEGINHVTLEEALSARTHLHLERRKPWVKRQLPHEDQKLKLSGKTRTLSDAIDVLAKARLHRLRTYEALESFQRCERFKNLCMEIGYEPGVHTLRQKRTRSSR